MRRSCKTTLKYASKRKIRHILSLITAYRSAVNFYILSLCKTAGKLDAETLARLSGTRLSERYKSQALKQALEIVVATKRSAKQRGQQCNTPTFKGSLILDSKFVTIEAGIHSFDLVIRLSGLRKGHRVVIMSKHTDMTRKWLAKPNAKLVQGCALNETGLILWVELPDSKPTTDKFTLAIDMGINKLLFDSTGKCYGTEFKNIRDKIRRKKPGSKAKRRALKERDNLIAQTVNLLPWDNISMLGIEDLTGIKTGKQKGRGKNFRKAIAPWTYRQIVTRIENKTSENRVRLIKVNPANTSRTCPSCGAVAKENRKGEKFKCVSCNYKADADYVGALNILARTLETTGSVESPVLKRFRAK